MAKTLNKTETKPTHDQIARRAYEIFDKNGRVPGQDVQNWLEAERQLVTAIELKEVAVAIQMPPKLAPRQQASARA
jgi:hypothetical protein